MNYKNAYYHMFNRMTDLIAQLETVDSQREQFFITPILKQIQCECEEICVDDVPRCPSKAPRSGGSV